MPSTWSRRTVLYVTGVTLGGSTLTGCLSDQPPAGSLVITNDHSEAHTVTVTVTKTSEDSDDIVRYDKTPPAEQTPVWQRDEQFTIGADERLQQEQFITETGAFHLEAQLDTGERDTSWVGYYEAAGGGIAEDRIEVDITGTGLISISVTHDD